MKVVSLTNTVSTAAELASEIVRHPRDSRQIVAIVGAPGSGKSTLADKLRDEIVQTHMLSAEVVPMDGFHYDNSILDARGLRPRKGSPNTFDVDGFESLLQRLSSEPRRDLAIPVFDRTLDLTRASARIIQKNVDILIVEGNYLLLDQQPWRQLRNFFTLTVKIDCPREVIEKRLIRRWLDLGMSEVAARSKVEGNDLLNADVIENCSLEAQISFLACG